MHPYQLVKDHRTNWESGNTQAVLNLRFRHHAARVELCDYAVDAEHLAPFVEPVD